MIKLTEKYTDFFGNEREEECYFHLSEAELADSEVSVAGGLSKKLKTIIATHDVPEIAKYFKEIILDSYGVISDDGSRFEKSEELKTKFSQSIPFSNIYMRLLDPDKMIKFIKGILPASVVAEINELDMKKAAANVDALPGATDVTRLNNDTSNNSEIATM